MIQKILLKLFESAFFSKDHFRKIFFLIEFYEGYMRNKVTNELELPLQFFIPNDQWTLITPVKVGINSGNFHEHKTDVAFLQIRIQRRPEFYMAALVFPFLVLYFLSALTFLIPVESGEKISFAMTVLLAQMVVTGSFLQILPASSLHLPSPIRGMKFVFAHLATNCLLAVVGQYCVLIVNKTACTSRRSRECFGCLLNSIEQFLIKKNVSLFHKKFYFFHTFCKLSLPTHTRYANVKKLNKTARIRGNPCIRGSLENCF